MCIRDSLSASLTSSAVSCNGGSNGSITTTMTGGTPPYNYNWQPGNISGQNISNLSAGSYTVTISDSKGCSLTDSITVSQPTPIILSTSSINSNCSLSNGQASVTASGGTAGYTYQWSPSGGNNSTASSLLSGGYTVTVTDGNGCVSTAGVMVNDNTSPVAAISSISNVTCNGGADGSASVSVSGGTGPFSYMWLPSGGSNSTATGLLPGTYTVTVTCLLYTSPSPRDRQKSRMPSSA